MLRPILRSFYLKGCESYNSHTQENGPIFPIFWHKIGSKRYYGKAGQAHIQPRLVIIFQVDPLKVADRKSDADQTEETKE